MPASPRSTEGTARSAGLPRAVALVALVAWSCSSTATSGEASLLLTPGLERDAWTRDPVPTRLKVLATKSGSDPSAVADVAWPAGELSMGTLDAATAYSFTVELRDAAGGVVMRGASPFVGSDEAATNELPVLCGRVGELARATTPLSLPWPSPSAAFVDGRYALLIDGTTSSELYDLAYLAPLVSATPLPLSPRAVLAPPSGDVLFVADAGLFSYSLATGSTASIAVTVDPSSLVGAGAVMGDDGSAYLVGATRVGETTTAVVRVDSGGIVTAHSLLTPRARAMATWVHGTGLVVLGGAATSTVEVLAASADVFVPQVAGVPSMRGGAAISLTDGEVLIGGALDDAGDTLPILRVALSCGSSCGPAANAGASLDALRGVGFAAGPSHGLFVGSLLDGTTAAFLVTESAGVVTATSVPLRSPRKQAAAISLGGGRVAILGGIDGSGAPVETVEVFTPP